jgi:tripartite-type tricarboxylate transporter receptor subunit TctC
MTIRFSRRDILAAGAAIGSSILVAPAGRVHAQAVQKPVRFVIGLPPGSSIDVAARFLIDRMKGYSSTIITEHKPGASYRIAVEAVKQSPADGSTVLLSPAGPLVLLPQIQKTVGYKPLEDFIPVTTVYQTPSALVVGPLVDARVRTIADFVAWCRANPGKSNYGTPGAGTPMHFLGAMLGKAAGFEFTHVPYQGPPPAVSDVLAGQIASVITSLPNLIPHVESGKLRFLATTGSERIPMLPGVPTMKEAGYPALEFSEWMGLFLPAKTPMAIVNALNASVREALKSEEMKTGLAKLALEPSGLSIDEFTKRVRADTDRWEPIVKASGFAPL